MQFQKAVRKQLKVKIGFMGTAGTGKTLNALSTATSLGERIAVIDSERGRAEAYAGDFEFDHLKLADTKPETYIGALALANERAYDVIVVDSISHEWAGKEGVLASVDRFGGWKEATPRHDAFIDALFAVPRHVICTMRAKTQYLVAEVDRADGRGKRQDITKLGLGPIQRDNVEYEFDLLGMLDLEHSLRLHKSVITGLPSGTLIEAGDDMRALGRYLADSVLAWVNEGEPVPAPVEADELSIESLRLLLTMEGFTEDKIDTVWAQRRLELGALTSKYVDEQLQQSAARLRAKGKNPEQALTEFMQTKTGEAVKTVDEAVAPEAAKEPAAA